jgi:hypothetical protein
MPATDVKWRLGREKWDAYFKFTVERNPWDKAVSAFFFAQRHPEERIAFEDWLPRNLTRSNFNFYTIGGKMAMDHVLRYESLAEDFRTTLHRLGLEDPPELPFAKTGFRPKNTHYTEVHTPFTRDYVARVCAPEIKYFGYRFEGEASQPGSATQ